MEKNHYSLWPAELASRLAPYVSTGQDMQVMYTNLRQAHWIIQHMRKRKLPFLYEKRDMVFMLQVVIEAIGNAGAAAFPQDFPEWVMQKQ